jgi:hypothetical protein
MTPQYLQQVYSKTSPSRCGIRLSQRLPEFPDRIFFEPLPARLVLGASTLATHTSLVQLRPGWRSPSVKVYM